jgi:hypothetical protein
VPFLAPLREPFRSNSQPGMGPQVAVGQALPLAATAVTQVPIVLPFTVTAEPMAEYQSPNRAFPSTLPWCSQVEESLRGCEVFPAASLDAGIRRLSTKHCTIRGAACCTLSWVAVVLLEPEDGLAGGEDDPLPADGLLELPHAAQARAAAVTAATASALGLSLVTPSSIGSHGPPDA